MSGRGACRFGRYERARAARESRLNNAPAAQNVGTRMFLFVAEATAGGGLNVQRQLASGKRSHTKNGGHHRCQQYVIDSLPAHDSLSHFDGSSGKYSRKEMLKVRSGTIPSSWILARIAVPEREQDTNFESSSSSSGQRQKSKPYH